MDYDLINEAIEHDMMLYDTYKELRKDLTYNQLKTDSRFTRTIQDFERIYKNENL